MKGKHLIITVGREYGSGGHDIAKLLAERMGLAFYDNELITIAAKESGLGEDAFRRAEHIATNSFEFAINSSAYPRQYGMNLNDRMYLVQSSVIRTIADREDAVIVGRCSNAVLENYVESVDIFIGANPEFRVKEVMARDNLNEAEAKKFMQKMDKYRATYYNFYTSGAKWGDRRGYDLCINRSDMTTEEVVDILEAYANGRRKALGI